MFLRENKGTESSPSIFHRRVIGGFTMIELIVSVSIIVLFSMIFLARYRTFSSRITLENLAYDIGLELRQAQVYGISVREQDDVGSGQFDYAYGVRFHMSNPQEFLTFVDSHPNGSSDGRYSDASELIERHTLRESNSISDLCALVSGTEKCNSTGELDAAHVTFSRPDPNANFITSPNYPQASEIKVYVESARLDERRFISVTKTGQISVSNVEASSGSGSDPVAEEPTYIWKLYGSYPCQPSPPPQDTAVGGEKCDEPNSFGSNSTATGDPYSDCPWTVNWYQCLQK